MGHHCSFCGKSETTDRKLIAGAEAFICSDCVRIASEAVGDLAITPKVGCAICRKSDSPENYLVIEGHGHLCAACVRAIRAATDALAK